MKESFYFDLPLDIGSNVYVVSNTVSQVWVVISPKNLWVEKPGSASNTKGDLP